MYLSGVEEHIPDVIRFLKLTPEEEAEQVAEMVEVEAIAAHARELETIIVCNLDMSDPDSWDWDGLLSGKLKDKAKLNEIFHTLLDELKRLDENVMCKMANSLHPFVGVQCVTL